MRQKSEWHQGAAKCTIKDIRQPTRKRYSSEERTSAGGATETNLALEAFPSPADLWARYRAWKGLTDEAEQIVL